MNSELLKVARGGDEAPSVSLTEGLVSHYLLNNNVDDSYGITDATSVGTEDFLGDSAALNGTNAYIKTEGTALLDFNNRNADFTISWWLKLDSNPSSFDSFFSLDNADLFLTNFHQITFALDGVGAARLMFNDGTNRTVASTTLNLDTLYHVIVKRESTTFSLHINDILIGSLAQTIDLDIHASNTCRFGAYKNATDTYYFMDGQLSNIRFYNVAKDAASITALYEEGYYPKVLPLPTTEGLIAHYPLTGTADDAHGKGGNESGTEYNGVSFIADATRGSVASFTDTTPPDYIDAPIASTGGDFSISGWIKKDDSTDGWVIHNRVEATDWNIVFYNPDYSNLEMVLFNTVGTPYIVPFLGIPIATHTKWYHFAVVVSANIISTYTDGVLDSVGGFAGTRVTSNSTTRLGDWNGNESYAYDGLMSDIRVYHKALTDTEITALYNEVDEPTDGLITHYPLTIEARAEDMWVSYDGTEEGGLTYIDNNEFGSVANFDGVSDYINCQAIIRDHTAFSTSAWFYNDNNYAVRKVILINHNAIFRIQDSGDMAIWDNRSGTGDYTLINYTLSNYLITGWNHIVLTANGTVYSLTINNVSVSFTTVTGNFASATAYMTIGRDSRNNNNYFSSELRNIRAYNKVLTTTEITDIYNYEKNFRPLDIDDGLVAYYPLSEKSLDNYYNQYDGVDTTMTYDGVGAIYDNIGDAIEVSTAPALDFNALTDSYTFSLWLKGPTQTANYTILQKGTSLDIPVIMFGDSLSIVYFRTYDGNGASQATLTQADVFDDTWHMVTFMVNNADDIVEVILDGVIYDDGPNNTISSTYSTLPMYIGNDGNKNRAINGSLAKLRIYNRVLSRDEIDIIYNIEKGDFPIVAPIPAVYISFGRNIPAVSMPIGVTINDLLDYTDITLNNLVDINGDLSEITIQCTDTGQGMWTDGIVTGDNSGCLYDYQLEEFYYTGNNTLDSGLISTYDIYLPAGTYTIRTSGSKDLNLDNQVGTYTLGAYGTQAVAACTSAGGANTTEYAEWTNVVSTGQIIELLCAIEVGSVYNHLNGLNIIAT